jgi:GNAT superfamily N-acetyltransferase
MAHPSPPPGFRMAAFDFDRHSEFVINCQIGSLQVSWAEFRPDAKFYADHTAWLREIAAGTRNDRLLILESDDGTPAAVIWLEIRTYNQGFDGEHDPEMWPELLGKVGAQFRNTYVAAAYRGHGLALYLKQVAESIAREAGAQFLYTRCGKVNQPMLALNAKLGYEAAPEPGDRHIRLRKKLDEKAW